MTDPRTPPNAPFFVDTEVITLTKNGVWMSDGTEITHEPTRKRFARIRRKDEKGYFLQISRETKRIVVEDTPYFVHSIEGAPGEGYSLVLNDETRERLDPATLSYRPGRLACRVKGGAEEAKFLHAAYFDLLRDLEEDSRGYFLVVSGARIDLARK